MSFTSVPDDAPRSDDGLWWWDGSDWQRVPEGEGQSFEGDGPGSPGWVEMGFEPAEFSERSEGVQVTQILTNNSGRPLADHEVYLLVSATSTNGAAEDVAATLMPLQAYAEGETRPSSLPVQLDAGEWNISMGLADADGNLVQDLGTYPYHQHGTVQHSQAFDDSQQYSLSLRITAMQSEGPAIYQVHYEVTNHGRHEVPAGLTVVGSIAGEGSGESDEVYHYTEALPAGRPVARLLTLGGLLDDEVTVTVVLDPGGPSETGDQVQATLRSGDIAVRH